jgi:hypothetical protein
MITYEEAFEDHRYLWETYAPAQDMTGGYVDQDDLSKLLASPTKITARQCLISQIIYWFEVGPDLTACYYTPDMRRDPALAEIAERYGCDLPLTYT